MNLESLVDTYEERLQEIEAYLQLLEALDEQVRRGPPMIGSVRITTQQLRILYSSVFLQLYNLVEATTNWCIKAVSAAASRDGRWKPGDLTVELRREWARSKARTHVDLNFENRLKAVVEFCDLLIQSSPIEQWIIEIGGGGNWDDKEIEDITKRLGFKLKITKPVLSGVKRSIRDDKGPLELIKDLRNKLAHGGISFSECAEGMTVSELRDITERTANYLREVVVAFSNYIQTLMFLSPERRAAEGGEP